MQPRHFFPFCCSQYESTSFNSYLCLPKVGIMTKDYFECFGEVSVTLQHSSHRSSDTSHVQEAARTLEGAS